jgi:hypothetical protein
MNSSFRFRGRGWTLLLLVISLSAFGQNWSGPANELAKEIAAASGPGTIALTVINSSSLPKDQVSEVQRALESQLRSLDVRLGTGANANNEVHVTFSENLQGLLWVAEIKHGTETQIAMVTVPRSQAVAPAKPGPAVVIHRALMWSQTSPILDALVLDSASPNARLLVLDADAITSYAIVNSRWEKHESWSITHGHVFPRDLRGLLIANQNRTLTAYLPGTICDLHSNAIACHDGDDPWQLGPRAAFFNSGRNYFTGALVPASDKPLAPFYSATWIDRPNYALGIISGIDGRMHVTDGSNDRTIATTLTADWGSDLAAIKTGCLSGAQLLVTQAGDDTTSDSLRAFDIPDREPILVSAPLEFPGPITALWTHDPSSAMVIAHNLRTGQYEAYSVSITCNQ